MKHSLEELEHLAKEATPGPWRHLPFNARVIRDNQGPRDKTGSVQIAECGNMDDAELVPFNAKRWKADAAFIAAARQAIPDLIQRVRELEAQIASMEKRDE